MVEKIETTLLNTAHTEEQNQYDWDHYDEWVELTNGDEAIFHPRTEYFEKRFLENPELMAKIRTVLQEDASLEEAKIRYRTLLLAKLYSQMKEIPDLEESELLNLYRELLAEGVMKP